jgi:hypothetical protein
MLKSPCQNITIIFFSFILASHILLFGTLPKIQQTLAYYVRFDVLTALYPRRISSSLSSYFVTFQVLTAARMKMALSP